MQCLMIDQLRQSSRGGEREQGEQGEQEEEEDFARETASEQEQARG